MENASKALIIAGSILIAIVLITIGIKILNNTKGVTEQAKKSMSALEVQMFNEQFTKYKGRQTAEQVKKLINFVITNNSENPDKQIKIRLRNADNTANIINHWSVNIIQNTLNDITEWSDYYTVTCETGVNINGTDLPDNMALINFIRIVPK